MTTTKLKAITEQLKIIKFVPVIVVENVNEALGLGKVLLEANLPVAEITFRSDKAIEALKAMKDVYPSLMIGAGTVLNARQAELARNAGADFVVSPGFNVNTVTACLKMGLPIIPGINNPMGIEMALEHGLTTVKFFPAEASGGIAMIKALLAPYRDILIMPTGGIGLDNVADYLKVERIIACGLSWMVDPKLLKEGNWTEVANRIAKLRAAIS